MITPPADLLGRAERTVVTADRDGVETKQLTVSRTYPTDVADLWDAITNPERIPRWFLPITGELRPGGRYQFEGNAGGEVLACEPPGHVAVTWEYLGEVTWVDLHLSGDDERATLRLVHVAPASQLPQWPEFGPGAVGIGWELGLMGLDLHLDSAAPVDPAAAAQWVGGPDGVAFITASSAAWADAAIAGGEDPEQARAAADRCTTAYTATEPTD